ncbi:hybrid non-ribosomal peptide synthetase/type I polyketide synthase [Burkholderia humptydooensis]|uniref:Hybrid non-ribosomal peptide synthetase/type I polyketide synthase n=2 Tax=Burkholderia humptydooensis TaxID=430531 RepID=A0A7U4PB35_9BURK|nr:MULTISPECIES: hybrid non-ribosomal peptide synthetase/type I polyketide synthase [Burkholderia]AJY40187.1 amino acid adenylation domain protein [Burkholderia sp. 2002721687]ALX46293.1 non-ribosomal peptide synthetase [Burkholderia humptydooensis]EIP84683.1 Amino acid adenylation [Burkholderia humptydooensis MSMB43]QPS47798.1 hybrid non-ribosomal peptide synthetase/type I polyketide synthase [Burkholderia humptydooensis]
MQENQGLTLSGEHGAIAIVGIACRFPGVSDVQAFWRFLLESRSAIRLLSDDALRSAGVTPEVLADSAYVRANGSLDNALDFDAAFFGYAPEEAALLDPQQRIFLETCWHALEDAALANDKDERIGVYGGVGFNTYLVTHLSNDLRKWSGLDRWRAGIANDKDTATSRVAYKLDLDGPAVTVQSACSTSLVAVHLACQSILDGDCDVALAGGASVHFPLQQGYRHFADGIEARDGVCRPFARDAGGTVFSDGVGVVVLRRCADARAAGDRIYAVIRGSAVNNDGADKAGYTAPGERGQAEVIRMAHAVAGVSGDDIDYVEAHGTGTAVGDRIELRALDQAFGAAGSSGRRCLLGSVKGNLGHTDNAAGIAGLIKTALSLHHGVLPPTLNVSSETAALPTDGRFSICDRVAPWLRGTRARLAGVSSFGIGGTNAHVVLQEAPDTSGDAVCTGFNDAMQAMPLVAPHVDSLQRYLDVLVEAAHAAPSAGLPDLAYTLQRRRGRGRHRGVLLARRDGVRGDLSCLRTEGAEPAPDVAPGVIWAFAGECMPFAGAGATSYRNAPVFAANLDRLLGRLDARAAARVRQWLLGGHAHAADETRVHDARSAYLATFVHGYALAQHYLACGVAPRALLGEGIGELIAATVSGMFSPDDALELAQCCANRLAPSAATSATSADADGGAGRQRDVDEADAWRASPSWAAASLAEGLLDVETAHPAIPVASCVTGGWLTRNDARQPSHWAMRAHAPARLADTVLSALSGGAAILQRIGVGTAPDSPFARCLDALSSCTVIADGFDEAAGVRPLAELWTRGVDVDWTRLHRSRPRPTSAPGYPFKRTTLTYQAKPDVPRPEAGKNAHVAHLHWVRDSRRRVPARSSGRLLCVAATPLPDTLRDSLAAMGELDVWMHVPDGVAHDARRAASQCFDFTSVAAWRRAWAGQAAANVPASLIYFDGAGATALPFDTSLACALAFASAIAAGPTDAKQALRIHWISSGLTDAEGVSPSADRAAMWGPARVLPQETSGVVCRVYDVAGDSDGIEHDAGWRTAAALIAADADADGAFAVFAVRGARVYAPRIETMPGGFDEATATPGPVLRTGGTYLVTGGAGGIGRALAAWLASAYGARVLVCGRRAQTALDDWRAFCEQHPSVVYVQADVESDAQLARLGDGIDGGLHAIHGVFHCAGASGEGVLLTKNPDQAWRRCAAKVRGVQALCRVFAHVPLDFMVLASSVNAWLGGVGQAEYCSANAYLDAFARSRATPWRVLSIAWDTWLDTGMARALRGWCGARPALAGRSRDAGSVAAHVVLPRDAWLLREHRVDGVALLPGTAHIALLLRVAPDADLSDVALLAPVLAPDGAGVALSVSRADASRKLDVSDASGAVVCTAVATQPDELILDDVPARWIAACSDGRAAPCAVRLPARLSVGPRWSCLGEVRRCGGLYRVELRVDALDRDFDEWPMHPAVMDAALAPIQSCAATFSVPVAFGRIRAVASLAAARYSYVAIRDVAQEFVLADVCVTDAHDVPLLAMAGVRFAPLDERVLPALAIAGDALSHGLPASTALASLERLIDGCALESLIVAAAPVADLANRVEQRAQRFRTRIADRPNDDGLAESEREAMLRDIVARHLGLESVAADANFFALGGDSLSGLLVIESAQKAGFRMSLADLYRAPTIAQLAGLNAAAPPAGPARRAEPFALLSGDDRRRVPDAAVDAFPLSALQQGIVYYRSRYGDATIYRDVLWAELESRVAFEPALLEQAWSNCVERHPVLRTVIDASGYSEPMQIVYPAGDASVTVEALHGRTVRDWLAERTPAAHYPIGRAVHLFALPAGPVLHVLLLLDDALLDGWSATSLLAELVAHYGRLLDGDAPVRPAPPALTFHDYVRHERDVVARDDARAFWREHLKDCAPSRVTRNAPSAGDSPPDIVIREMPFGAAGSVDAVARAHGATPKVVLLAAYLRALSLWCGTLDVVVGLETHTRVETDGGAEVLGLHLNTVPLRHVFASMPVGGYLAALMRTEAQVIAHRHLPLSDIQRPWSVALFDNCFNYTHFRKLQAIADTGALGRALQLRGYFGEEKTHYPFKLWVDRDAATGAYRLYLAFDRARVAPEQADAFALQFDAILSAFARTPDANVLTIGVAPVTRLEMTPSRLAGAPVAVPELGDLFEPAWAAHAARIALREGDREYSYRTLAASVQVMARRLLDAGDARGAIVAIIVPRSFRWVVALLGVMKAGATAVLIDPRLPAVRIDAMLRASQPAFVIADELGAGCAFPSGRHVAPVDGVSDPDQVVLERWPSAGALPAYLIFTSGSTGEPKGVVGTRAGLSNRIAWQLKRYPLEPGDVCLAKTAASFVDVFCEVLGPLCAGALLVLPDDAECRDAGRIAELLQQHRITHLVVVPTLLESLLTQFELRPSRPRLALRRIAVSGEPLTRGLVRRVRALLPTVQCLNLYGSAEVAADVSAFALDACADSDDPGPGVPVGAPLDNLCLHVLDANLDPAPPGGEGELYVSGAALAHGYLGQPALTAERFMPNPWARERGDSRLFRTGDLARVGPHGVEIVGRRDRQIKVRGVRVDLDGVEACLERLPRVRRAAVIEQHGVLIAFLQCAPECDPDAWRQALRAQLSAEARPAQFWRLEQMPLTPTGKIDRAALRTTSARRLESAAATSLDDVEAALAGLWRELLPDADVTRDSRFDEAGGHSLLLLQLGGLIERRFGCRLSVAELLAAPTLADEAQLVRAQRTSAPAATPLVGDPAAEAVPFAPTPLQQAYWIARHQAGSDGGGSHLYQEWEIARLDADRLTHAWNRLIVRHGMLRARFDGDGQLSVQPARPYRIACRDLRDLDPARQAAVLLEWRERHAFAPLPLDGGPLFDLRVFRLSAEMDILVVKVDFLIADAWSLGMLARECATLYRDPDAALPALDISFRDVLEHRRRHADPAIRDAARRYWRERLASLPGMPALPVRNDADARLPVVRRRALTLDADAQRALAALAARVGVPASSLYLAAYVAVLQRWSERKAFSITLTWFDRPPVHPHVNRVAGDFTSVLWLEIDGAPAASFFAFARAVHARLLADLDHRDYGGVEVAREARHASATQDAMRYVFTHIPELDGGAASFASLGTERHRITRTAGVWIDNQVVGEGGLVRLHWDSVDERFAPGVIDDMFAAYRDLVIALTAAPDEVNAPSVRLPAAQRARRRATERESEPGEDYLSRFARRCREAPDAAAVIASDRTLTYGALWTRATRLAARLTREANGATCVALHMTPGWRYAVAALAVQLAGFAYVPLSLRWPRERVARVIDRYGIRYAFSDGADLPSRPDRPAVRTFHVPERDDEIDLGEFQPVFDSAALAYVMFTSGSSGEPKGVMMRRHAVANTLDDLRARLRLGAGDRVLGLSDPGFDLSVFDLFGTLSSGAALVMPDASARMEPGAWWALCVEHRVTIWNTAPALFELLVDYAKGKTARIGTLPLRWVMLSGDWIALHLPDALRELAPGARFLSLGGATEAGIWSVSFPVATVAPDWTRIPYGMPLRGQRCDIVDSFGLSCPDGVAGELTIAGASLSDGYWQRDDLTAQAFVVDALTGERRYRTGDFARYRADGVIELLGRIDSQVKIAGHRIECAEIEHVIGACGGVSRAVVVPVAGRAGVVELHAVLQADDALSTERIRLHCGERLPAYMVPRHWHRDMAIPLNDNGKLDRRVMRERIEAALMEAE